MLDRTATNINSPENYEIESTIHYYPFKYHSIYYNNYEKDIKFAPDIEINKILEIKVDNGQFYFDIYNFYIIWYNYTIKFKKGE